MHILTAKHWTDIGTSMKELEEGLKELKKDGNTIGRPTVSANMDPWYLPETKSATKEHTWAGPRPWHI